MPMLPSRPDLVVIGAGAAGIAAAREARRLGLDVLVLEARDRLGGRAHTASCGTPFTFDLGCEWLHSADRNVLAALAPELGFTLDKSDPPWRRRHPQRGFGEADYETFEREQAAFYTRLEEAAAGARLSGHDRAASELLDPAARWNGFADAISTYYNGAPFSRVSVLDFDAYLDTEVNWRVQGGYGAMIAAAGADLPVKLGCRVRAVEADGKGVRVVTDGGAIDTDAVIVTVSTSVLAGGAIAFPAKLDAQLHAAAGLPCGVADKVYFALESSDGLPPDGHLIGDPESRDCGSYTLRAGGRAIVEGYFGGDYARELEKGGLDAFTAAARREIGWALGRDVADRLKPIVATGWAQDAFALGSYSHALPGHAGDRAILATPVDPRIVFAGEATSPHFFSTAHGAFEEGLKAARALAPDDRAAAAGGRR